MKCIRYIKHIYFEVYALKNICLKANYERKPVGEVISVRLHICKGWLVFLLQELLTRISRKNEKLVLKQYCNHLSIGRTRLRSRLLSLGQCFLNSFLRCKMALLGE